MRAGKLARIVQILRFGASGPNEFGTVQLSWQVLAAMRAELVELTGAEAIQARGAADELATVFRVRNKVAITTADRLTFRNTTYRIAAVSEVAGGHGLELHCLTVPVVEL